MILLTNSEDYLARDRQINGEAWQQYLNIPNTRYLISWPSMMELTL